jgi:glycosyltransferase involved in cell wall biosynthesis
VNLKISIITVTKNSEQFLEETIESVITQSYKNIEYIIIDGKSTDRTIEIINKYLNNIAYYHSEADHGMYEAINKGLAAATGDYILILNSDDILVNQDVIYNVVKEINVEKLNWYYGNIINHKDSIIKERNGFKVGYKELLLSTHGTFVPHPCFFISKQLNIELKGYNTNYKFASDYDYILRALKNGNGRYINMAITIFRIHTESITSSGRIEKERKEILIEHQYLNIHKLKRRYYYYKLWIYYKIINLI